MCKPCVSVEISYNHDNNDICWLCQRLTSQYRFTRDTCIMNTIIRICVYLLKKPNYKFFSNFIFTHVCHSIIIRVYQIPIKIQDPFFFCKRVLFCCSQQVRNDISTRWFIEKNVSFIMKSRPLKSLSCKP